MNDFDDQSASDSETPQVAVFSRRLSGERAALFGFATAAGLIFLAVPIVDFAYISGLLAGQSWSFAIPYLNMPLHYPIPLWVIAGLALSVAANGRRIGEVCGAIAVLAIGIGVLCGIVRSQGLREHRFFVAEIADTHQRVAIILDDGDTVIGRELDANGRFKPGITVIPNPGRDLRNRVLKDFSRLRQTN